MIMKKLLKQYIQITYPVLVLIILLMIYFLYQSYRDYERKAYQVNTIVNGLYIVNAIEKYFTDNKELPRSLDDLTPTYLPRLFPARWGDSGWIYEKEREGFSLTVGYKQINSLDFLYPVIIYDSSTDSWTFND